MVAAFVEYVEDAFAAAKQASSNIMPQNYTQAFVNWHAQDLCCLARLGKDGSIKQIAGPQEESREDIWKGPTRRVSFAIFEIA